MIIEELTSDENEKFEELCGNKSIPLSDLIDEFDIAGDRDVVFARKPRDRRKVKK